MGIYQYMPNTQHDNAPIHSEKLNISTPQPPVSQQTASSP
jgi:hypothetical protein